MNMISTRSNVRCAVGIALVLSVVAPQFLHAADGKGGPQLPDGKRVNRVVVEVLTPPREPDPAGPRLPDGQHLNPTLDQVTKTSQSTASQPVTVEIEVPALLPVPVTPQRAEYRVPRLFPTTEAPDQVAAAESSWLPAPAEGAIAMQAAQHRTLSPAPAAAIDTPAAAPTPSPAVTPIATVPPASAVEQAACQSCAKGLGGPSTDLMTSDPSGCYPGRFDAGDDANPSHALGRFLYGIYNCVCVPDPCYEPNWTPLADTAFFTPTARPVSQTRFRTKLSRGLATPDRAEYFWAKGTGGSRPDGRRVDRVADDGLAMYTEAATGRVGVYTELTYRRVRPDDRPGSSGFGDLVLGTKTLLLDCELLQIAFQFETTVPSASQGKGLGTGHTTLEPSVILGLKLSDRSYFQAQVAEWIPLGGDPEYAGSAIRYSCAYNHVLCRPLKSCPTIGTMEFRGVTFQDGAYTDPITGTAIKASGSSYLSIGPGVRQFICDRADLGFSTAYGVGSAVGPRQEYRIDLRVRY